MKNALKFTAHGYIKIKACYFGRPYSRLYVEVIDSGKGIDPSELPKLFSRFGQLQRTARMNSMGNGLGLFISKQIVESCGG